MSTFREERRADRLMDAQIKREDAAAAVQRRINERAALARDRREERAELDAQRLAAKKARHDRRSAAMTKVRRWAGDNIVDLLIYPAVLVAFVMSAPSMAKYGHSVYHSWLGALLPAISELLMFAFALAVLVSRRRTPERPVWSLQLGVVVFAAVSGGLNFLHGATDGWSAGVVMAVVAVSGITAHQLTLATPPRSRAERADARIARRMARKVMRARKAAIRQAVAEVDENGHARLVHRPGRYVLERRGGRNGFRPTLTTQVVPAVPVPVPDLAAELADEVSAWLSEQPESWSAEQPGNSLGTAETGSGDAVEHGGSQDPRVPELVARVRAAIDAGQLAPSPSRGAVRSFLKVRTAVAGAVVKALNDDGGTSGVLAA